MSRAVCIVSMLAISLALAACGSAPKGSAVETPPARVACTAAQDEAFVISFFSAWKWLLKIAQSVDERDVKQICKPAAAAPASKAASS